MSESNSYLSLPLLHVFHRVAERGSFQAAATELQLPRSSVSKKIRQLEEVVGQPLLQRSTRQLQLTDVGRRLLADTGHLGALLNHFRDAIDHTQASPRGRVKISASTLMGQIFLIHRLQKLRDTYPDIALSLSFDDRTVDLLTERVDIAIRIGQLPDSSLIARKIGDKSYGWFASPGYLARRGAPQSPDDLKHHQCLAFGDQIYWSFEDEGGQTRTVEIAPAISADNGRALVDMACQGLGIIMVDPNFIAPERRAGQLAPLLSHWRHPESSPIHLVCVGERTRAAQAVWQFLLAESDQAR